MGNNIQSYSGSPKDSDSTDKININPIKLFGIIRSRWYIVLISIAVCLSIGYLYAKSAKEKFLSEALMRYDSKSDESKFSTEKMLMGGGGESSDYMAEVYSIKSTPVIYKALDSLHFHLKFVSTNGLRDVNIYPLKPFSISGAKYDIELFPGGQFTFINEKGHYNIRFENEDYDIDTLFQNVRQGTVVSVPGLSFTITEIIPIPFRKIQFTYVDYWAVKGLSESVIIKEADRNMPVLRANFVSDNGAFTRDFLKTLLSTYFNFNMEAKKRASEQTLSFIELQLNAFEGLMRTSSTNLQNIKQRYDVLDVGATSSQYMSSVADLRNKKIALEIQGQNFDLVTEAIKNNKDVVANVVGWDGVPDPFLSDMLQELNVKNAQRKQGLINFSEESIVIKNLTEDIAILKRKIIENINLQRKKSEQAYKVYNDQLASLNRDLSRMPSAEKDLIYSTSDVDVNKNIYTLLLNKKLETAIDKAAQTPSFAMIEVPQVAVRTSPYEKLIILIAGLIGLALGVVIVFMKRFVNSRFTNIGAISRMGDVSLLGIINHFKDAKGLDEASLKNIHENNGPFTESINSIRTSIIYQANAASGGSIIAVTSEMSNEGKSFVALNVATALTRLDKSVLLIATDMRRSGLHRVFNRSNEHGLSTYLENDNAVLPDVIKESSITGLHFITSGPVPANPSELILKDRFWHMLDELKTRFDYIILDTAPVGMVSDSLPILRKANMNIFVVRWLHSSQESPAMASVLAHEHHLENISIVVNDYKRDGLYESLSDNYGMYYNNKGGYYADEYSKRRSLWKRLVKPTGV